MKKYVSFFRMRFRAGLQYRAAALAGIATQFAWGGMNILLYAAFYRADPSAFPMTFRQLSSYIWLQQAFLALFMVWFTENELFAMISGGAVAYELCRPADLYGMWFARSLANRWVRALLRSVPLIAVAVFLPAPYGLGAPASGWAFALFVLSLILASLVVCAFCMLIYASAFFTLSSAGVRLITAAAVEFLAGAVIPLPFMPEGFRTVLELLPFASMQNKPLLIYSGGIGIPESTSGIVLQLFWFAALLLAGRAMMGCALRRTVIQGG